MNITYLKYVGVSLVSSSLAKGRRLPDTRLGELPLELDGLLPGDIWKYLNGDGTPVSAKAAYPDADMSGNLTDCMWGYRSPDGNGIGTLALHTVREHEDGTVSVRPGDGSSNSVRHTGGPDRLIWHGSLSTTSGRRADALRTG